MGVNKSLKFAVITAMTFLFTVLISTPGEAGLWEWLTGQQDSLIPVYDPGVSARKAEPVAAAEQTSSRIISNKLVENVITGPLDIITPEVFKPKVEGQTHYLTKWVRVPTTRYFPQLERSEQTGWTHVVMKPCTSYSWQLRRVPVTSYRPLLPQILPAFPQFLRPCDENTPLLGRILNPLLAPGCGGCIISQRSSPTPAKTGLEANRLPKVDLGTMKQDREAAGGLEIRNRPDDGAAEAEAGNSSEDEAAGDADAETPEEAAAEEPEAADETPPAEGEAAAEEINSVLEEAAIEPPEEKKVPGQKDPVQEQDAGEDKPENEAAAPYKLQPIPDANRLPRINPAKAPRVLDPRDKTASTPITVRRLIPVSVPAPGSPVVRVTAVVPATGTIRKLDESGWVRLGK